MARFFLISPIVALALLGGCGDKAFSPGTAGQPVETAEAAADGTENRPQNISQELLDKLKETADDTEAAMLEQEIWDAWLVSGSATVDTLMRRGLEYQEMDDLEAARDAFDKAIAIKPDYAEAWARRAGLFFHEGKYDEAIADLESAITYEPRHFGAWTGLAMIFESVERPEAALKAYEKVLEIHPKSLAAEQGKRRLERVVNGRSI